MAFPSISVGKRKKFFYQLVRKGARAREYEDALRWLVSLEVVAKISRCTKPALPLSSYEDLSTFKLYLVDVALLRRLAQLDITSFLHPSRLFTECKGAFTENYILQALFAL